MQKLLPLLFIFTFLVPLCSYSQISDTTRISAEYKNAPIELVLKETGEKYNLRFYLKKEWVEGLLITVSVKDILIEDFIELILKKTSLSYIAYDPSTIVLLKKSTPPKVNSYTVVSEKKKEKIIKRIITPNSGKKELILSGRIANINSDVPLSASIFIKELNRTFLSAIDGAYSISLPQGSYSITFRSLGFAEEIVKIDLRSDFRLDVKLAQENIELKEAIVEARGESKNVTSINMSTNTISIQEIKKMPAFLGEADVIKSILLLPGVTTVGEGASGFNVRGGSVDQNLILMDGAPLFNSSHFFGFFSVFNPDMVKEVTLFKGGIPSQYGGRISSVLASEYLAGSYSKFHVKASVGPIISKIAVEGPIIKNKISFILGGRAAYPNWILKRVPNVQVRRSNAWFYDFNGKLSYQLNEKNLVTYSGYFSKDNFKLENDSVYSWRNAMGIIKWKHKFSKMLSSSVSALSSNYDFNVNYAKQPNAFILKNKIKYAELKAEVEHNNQINNIFIGGISLGNYFISPGSLAGMKNAAISSKVIEDEKAMEVGVYLNDEYKINDHISVTGGVRFSSFYSYGRAVEYEYLDGTSRETDQIADTTYYKKLELIKPYFGVEPRASINFTLNTNNSLKFSYNRIKQYIHLITNTTAVTPLDIWKISDKYVSPSSADHFGVGYFKNFDNNIIEASLEVYYKKLTDLIDYKDGAELLLNEHIETELIAGIGRACGVEVMLRKNTGKLTGWISYGYSRTERKVKGRFAEETINFGKYFPANYDKPHDLKIVGTYQVRRRFSASFNFNYSTGRPITTPDSKYIINGVVIPNYLYRNNARIPDYHRLDVAITYDGKNKKQRKYENSFTISVYNVYGRKNPYSVFYKHEMESVPAAYRLAVVGSPIPSISYNIRF